MTVIPFDWKSTGRTDSEGREIKMLRKEKGNLPPAMMVGAGVLTFLAAVAAGIVSYHAQYTFLIAEKGNELESVLGAALLDVGAIVFTLLGLALALNGHKVLVLRALNISCIVGSIYMNAALANLSSVHSIVAWSSPAIIYALLSDQLISAVRRMTLGPSGPGLLSAAHGVLLWLLRLVFHPITTLKGFRDWTGTLPSAPGCVSVTAQDERPVIAAPVTVERVSAKPKAIVSANSSVSDARTDRVIEMLSVEPTLTGKEIGERLNVSEATGRRILRSIREA